jgi:hypothetical protein
LAKSNISDQDLWLIYIRPVLQGKGSQSVRTDQVGRIGCSSLDS